MPGTGRATILKDIINKKDWYSRDGSYCTTFANRLNIRFTGDMKARFCENSSGYSIYERGTGASDILILKDQKGRFL